ncbi:MAG: amphi-Trp domain-containing protein [Nannocystis sp.]|uniref:amphi-Trp domain-containing protein n=1 Tax=Nannocystis sp. TaxID=1962667 RepID=UPI002420DE5A|nr:amphi-Trp domain-containing protein [Nannocystis sp.]MBK9752771.1 amphi-Trp domain-containing protein [Nannocystis sp.]
MKHARKDLKVDGAVELPHVVAYLEQLVQALKAGTVRVRQDDEEIVLGPRGVVGFSLSARDRGRRQTLNLELTWRKFNAPDPALDLHIDAAPAEPAAPTEPATASEPAADAEAHELPASHATPDAVDASEAKGEAHEGELHTADVYMHNPRGGNNRDNP